VLCYVCKELCTNVSQAFISNQYFGACILYNFGQS
jgi:hypothetical protein